MTVLYHVKNPAPSGAGIHAFIAIPSYDGKLHGPCLWSLLQALPVLKRDGIDYDVFVMGGNCHVDDARNGCLREFIKTKCTDLFFIDADVGFDPEAVGKLLRFDRDIVAGVYPKKCDEEDFPVSLRSGQEIWSDAEGLVEVLGAPTGFMRIRRCVVEKMLEANKYRRFAGQHDDGDSTPYTVVFERTFEGTQRLSGDYAFCRKWQQLGGKVYVDPELVFTHEGIKEWGGVLSTFWHRKYGLTETRAKEAVERLRKGESELVLFSWLYEWWNNQFSAHPDMLEAAYHIALETKGPILEAGSGITTIILACAAEYSGNQVLALEHEVGWLTKMSTVLDLFNLRSATVQFMPLQRYDGFDWYQKPSGSDCYSLVLCDGPQRRYGRAGLFNVMRSQIVGATILMDDTDDPEQLIALTGWACGNSIDSFGRFSVYTPPKFRTVAEPSCIKFEHEEMKGP